MKPINKSPYYFQKIAVFIAFFVVYYALIIWMGCKSAYPGSCVTDIFGFAKWVVIGTIMVLDGSVRYMAYCIGDSELVKEHNEFNVKYLPDKITKIYFIPRVFILMLMCRSIEMSHFLWDIYVFATAVVDVITLLVISVFFNRFV